MSKKKFTKADFLVRIEACKKKIADARDELRELLSDAEAVLAWVEKLENAAIILSENL